ncbi:hypothetical protein GGF42_004618 [Coemansia sp. RSA 2424]|nr:hypothetical protein GGF42_004618 [Coemansia sp. RSA 2424]
MNSGARAYDDGERSPLIYQPYCPPPAPLSPEDIRQRRRSLGLESQLTADARSYDGTWPNSAAVSAVPSPLPLSPAIVNGTAYQPSYDAVASSAEQHSLSACHCRPSRRCCAAACGLDNGTTD